MITGCFTQSRQEVWQPLWFMYEVPFIPDNKRWLWLGQTQQDRILASSIFSATKASRMRESRPLRYKQKTLGFSWLKVRMQVAPLPALNTDMIAGVRAAIWQLWDNKYMGAKTNMLKKAEQKDRRCLGFRISGSSGSPVSELAMWEEQVGTLT